jgi:hypothetical protein
MAGSRCSRAVPHRRTAGRWLAPGSRSTRDPSGRSARCSRARRSHHSFRRPSRRSRRRRLRRRCHHHHSRRCQPLHPVGSRCCCSSPRRPEARETLDVLAWTVVLASIVPPPTQREYGVAARSTGAPTSQPPQKSMDRRRGSGAHRATDCSSAAGLSCPTCRVESVYAGEI